SAIRLHDMQSGRKPGALYAMDKAIDVITHKWTYISICHRCISAFILAYLRTDMRRSRHIKLWLLIFQPLYNLSFVRRIDICVQEANGHRLITFSSELTGQRARGLFVRRLKTGTIRGQTLR